jgi:hypothetical protein
MPLIIPKSPLYEITLFSSIENGGGEIKIFGR